MWDLLIPKIGNMIASMEDIMDFLRRRLMAVGPASWEQIAAAAGCAKTLPRKIAYRDRLNPRMQTVGPLISYFDKVDRGLIDLPRSALVGKQEA